MASISHGNPYAGLTGLRMRCCPLAEKDAAAFATRVKGIADQICKQLPKLAGVAED